MFLIDTNVISELMRATPAPSVLNWFSAQDPSTLNLSAVTEAELRTGIAILPAGQRREGLKAALDATISEDFDGRILPFDTDAAKTYAEIAAGRRSAGRPIADADWQIAAIARSMGAMVATCNIRDFDGCGVPGDQSLEYPLGESLCPPRISMPMASPSRSACWSQTARPATTTAQTI